MEIVTINQVSNKWRQLFNQKFIIDNLKKILNIYGMCDSLSSLMIKYYLNKSLGVNRYLLRIRINDPKIINSISLNKICFDILFKSFIGTAYSLK